MTAVALLERRLVEMRRVHLAPPPKLTVSEWADRHRVVSSYSAEPGPWRTDRTPYLREIMDSFSDPTVQMVVFQKCARIGGTEAGLNVVGYFIEQDPSPILIVQPTVDDAKDFSKEQLAPMLADTPVLQGKVSDPRSRDSANTVQSKQFPGGALFLVGANSPRGFRRRTARVLDLEEIDGYPMSAGTEGDPLKLAMRRAATFAHRRKIYLNSTPTLKGLSRIEDYFLRSDQRRYHLPCLACDHRQHLVWRNLKYEGLPEPRYVCAGCGVLIPEEEKFRMNRLGHWRPGADSAIRGYHINALYSPWVTWSELRDEWLEAQHDLSKLQVFVNTALGETWEDRGGGLEPDALEAGGLSYEAEVPAGVGVLTCGVDVQDDRLEYVVRGWGQGEESWLVRHERIVGDPTKPAVWAALDGVLAGSFRHASGSLLQITATCIDSGHHTEAVYNFCRPRFGRRVYAVKGSSTPGAPLAPRKPTRNNKGRVALFLIGTDAAKDLIYGRLRLAVPGPGFLHFPVGLSPDYFIQLTAEKLVKKQVTGRWIRRYELPRGQRNEAMDCEVYALAALHLAPIDRHRLGRYVERAATVPPPPAQPPPPPPDSAATMPRPIARPRRGGWVKRW